MADLEIHRGVIGSAGSTSLGNCLARFNPVSGAGEQAAAVAVERHVAVAVVEDGDQAKPAQPIGEHHATIVNRSDIAFLGGIDQQPVMLELAAGVTVTEATDNLAFRRPGQLVLE